MEIKQNAISGTLESSDIQITLTPSDKFEILLDSEVYKEFGSHIKAVIKKVLDQYNIDKVHVKAVDKGALDSVIKARTIAAAQRALETTDKPNWEVF